MQTLGEIADGITAHGHVLDEAQNAPAVLRGNALLRLHELFQQRPGNVVLEVLVCRQCDHDAARQVLGEAGDLVGELGDIVLADVRQEHVGQEVSCGHGLPGIVGSQRRPTDVLVEVSDLDDLVLDVRGLGDAVVLRDGGGCAEHHVSEAGLADVGPPVVGGEALHERLAEFRLAVHEDVLGRHLHVLEDDDRLLPAELRVTLVDLAALHGAEVAALATVDVGQPLGIHRHRARDGEGLLRGLEALPRHDDHPVRVQGPGLMHLAAAEHHGAIRLPRMYVHEHVWVLLLARAHRAVALRIGHRAAQDPILALAHGQERSEALVVLRAMLLVDVVGRAPDRVGGVHADAPLKARASPAAELPLHKALLHEVLRRLRDVQEAAHTVTGEADSGPQLRVVGAQAIGLGDTVHRRPHQGVVDEVLHSLSEHDDADVTVPQ
mmetsp:Transcript_99307/g.286565  ORF Transcript_99307/g.286565 Transcript_99307/m.286565 type:complete len:436 (-) Transcript_99307:304-1611(-)